MGREIPRWYREAEVRKCQIKNSVSSKKYQESRAKWWKSSHPASPLWVRVSFCQTKERFWWIPREIYSSFPGARKDN